MELTPGPKPRMHLFGFLDETGLLHTPPTDRFFGLGAVITPNPRELHRAIVNYKNSRQFHTEFKFVDVRMTNVAMYKGLVDLFFACRDARFVVDIYDKNGLTISTTADKLYNELVGSLIASSIERQDSKHSEYITLLADDVSKRKDDKFEHDVRDKIRQIARRNALFGMCRLESHAVSEIQLCDVLLGTVAYAFKIKHNLVRANSGKVDLVKHLQKKLAVPLISERLDRKLPRGERFTIREQ